MKINGNPIEAKRSAMGHELVVLMAGLQCQLGDIGVLDDIGEDLYDVVFTLYGDSKQPTLSNILDEVFRRGTETLKQFVEKRIRELNRIASGRKITAEESDELAALRKLNPIKDLQWAGQPYANPSTRPV